MGTIYQLQIKLLSILSPVTLFHKLGMLNWYSKTLHDWIDPLVTHKSLRALDVACASGYLSEYLHQSGHSVSGIDSSKAMIRAARKQNPDIDFVIGNANQLPYANESFDIVFAASLIKIIRVCKKNGWVTFLFPVSGFTDEDLNHSTALLNLQGFGKAALHTWHKSVPKISIETVSDLLKNQNLCQIEQVFYLNGMIASVAARKAC